MTDGQALLVALAAIWLVIGFGLGAFVHAKYGSRYYTEIGLTWRTYYLRCVCLGPPMLIIQCLKVRL
jgi:hypothetical protein